MRILLLVFTNQAAYSVINQAFALSKGLTLLRVTNKLVLVSEETDLEEVYNSFKPDIVTGVGNCLSYPSLVADPVNHGFKVLPWVFADDYRINRFIDEYNSMDGRILTISRHCKRNLVRSGVKPDKIMVLLEAVDTDLWYKVRGRELLNFLELISIPDTESGSMFKYDLLDLYQNNVPIIFTTGGPATQKGAQEVMRALSIVGKEIPWVYIIKTWPIPSVLEKTKEEIELAVSLGINERVRYIIGEFSQSFLRNLMNISSIYASPSRVEGFGLPLVEAQMCGKCVVAMNATSTKEIIMHKKTGFLCRRTGSKDNIKADINDLAKYLRFLLLDSVSREETGRRAFEYARKNYSPKVIASKYLNYARAQ